MNLIGHILTNNDIKNNNLLDLIGQLAKMTQ